MLTIGASARLGGVSVRTLRHYEQVGVLMPEDTDPATGYRYYRARQFPRLHRIQALKDLGLSLQQLRTEGPGRDGVVAVEGDEVVMELQLPVAIEESLTRSRFPLRG